MLGSVILGNDERGQGLHLGDIERRSGLYILGKPGMGKSVLAVNMMLKDSAYANAFFFLDPHGEAISDLITRIDPGFLLLATRLYDPEDETYSFGINLLSCKNVRSLTERTKTYTRAYNVFYKLWEDEWGPWLQLILQNTLWAFIENPYYTLAEVPMFLNPRNSAFRDHIVEHIKYNPAVAEFWRHEFFERRERDQQERVDAALTRVSTLLTHPYVRHIIGQKKTTIDFARFMDGWPHMLLVKLSANLSPDIKKFIGTILVSELLHAVRARPEDKRTQFGIYIDEFQNFTSSDDFTTLITEGRKFGVATTILHVERYGQFVNNQKLLGATLAAVNKVFFQLTVKDAEELAPEFAELATDTRTRLGGELIISPRPVEDIWEKGHPDKNIMDYRKRYFWLYELLRTRPQEKYFQFDPKTISADTFKREFLHFEFFTDWAMYRSSIETIREGIFLLNEYYYKWMSHKYSTRLPPSDEEIEIMVKVVKCFGGVFGWYPPMEPYVPDETLGLLSRRIKERGERSFERHASEVHARNRAHEQYRDQWARAHPFQTNPTAGYPPSKFPLNYEDLEEFLNESKRLYTQVPKLSQNVAVNEIEALRKIAIDYGMTGYELENLVQWRIRELKEIEKDALEGLIRLVANKTSNQEEYNAKFSDVSRNFLMVMVALSQKYGMKETDDSALKIAFERATWQSIEIQTFILFCFEGCGSILEKNPMQNPSGRFDEEPKREKTQAELVDEAAQKLSNLPRFSAYAKVIDEKDGNQIVKKGKIQTLNLPRPFNTLSEAIKTAKMDDKAIKRDDIEEEIQKRQERWRRNTRSAPTAEEPRK